MNLKKTLLFVALAITLPLAYNNCGQARFTTTSESLLPSGTRVGNPLTPVFVKGFKATPNFSTRICVVEIILEDSAAQDTSFPITPTIVDFDSNGFSLPAQNFPNGIYYKFSMIVLPSCNPMTSSQDVTNTNGSFSANTSYAVSFSGVHTITGDGSIWNMDPQLLIDQLEQVTSDADIEPRMRLNLGTF